MPPDSHSEFVGAFRSDVLDLTLLPTEQCNCRCDYCYEDFEIGKMRPAVVAGVKALIASRAPELRRLGIAWFGGEPLAAVSLVEEIGRFAREQASRYPQLSYDAGMTTNAYKLDIATATRLEAAGVHSYQITLDGPKDFHDTTRKLISGRGTFDQIWQNLIALRESSLRVTVMIRLHVTATNQASLPAFAREIGRELLIDPRFTITLQPIGHWGGAGDSRVPILKGAERTQVLKELRAVLAEFRDGQVIYDGPGICYAAKPNSLLVRATGRIAKCTVALADPANDIGFLRPDGSLKIRAQKLQPWLRGWHTGDANALGCPLVGLPRAEGQLAQARVSVRPVPV